MPTELGRALVASDIISPEALADALYHAATRGVALPRALIDIGALDAGRLQEELDRAAGDVALSEIALAEDLAAFLPDGVIERLYAAPIVGIEHGAFRVGLVDVRDHGALAEIGGLLGAPVTPVRITLAALEAALARRGAANLPIALGTRRRVRDEEPEAEHTPPYGFRTLFPETGLDPDDADPMPLSRPAKSKSPVALASVPLPDVGAIFAALRAAEQKDRVLDLLIAGARSVSRRVGVFVVRRDAIVGYRASSLFGDESAFRRVRLTHDDGNVLADVARGDMHLGRIVDVAANAPLTEQLGLGRREVAIVAVRIEGIAALVLLVDELYDAFVAATRLEDLAIAAGDALARIVRAQRER